MQFNNFPWILQPFIHFLFIILIFSQKRRSILSTVLSGLITSLTAFKTVIIALDSNLNHDSGSKISCKSYVCKLFFQKLKNIFLTTGLMGWKKQKASSSDPIVCVIMILFFSANGKWNSGFYFVMEWDNLFKWKANVFSVSAAETLRR